MPIESYEEHGDDPLFSTVEMAMAQTIYCYQYKCHILPLRCEQRIDRGTNGRNWLKGDNTVDFDICINCEQFLESKNNIAGAKV
jgi:hypothetical protein